MPRLMSYHLNSIVTVGSKINQDFSVFFCYNFRTVDLKVPKFCEFSVAVIRHV